VGAPGQALGNMRRALALKPEPGNRLEFAGRLRRTFPPDERRRNLDLLQSLRRGQPEKEKVMRKTLLAISGLAVALTAAPATAKTYVCTKWKDGVCVSTHRVKGVAPYKVGYVFGPTYAYTPVSDIPQPVVTYYHLDSKGRYVYSNGYVYVVDPTTYAVTRVLDVISR
jgi:hypothetical protein